MADFDPSASGAVAVDDFDPVAVGAQPIDDFDPMKFGAVPLDEDLSRPLDRVPEDKPMFREPKTIAGELGSGNIKSAIGMLNEEIHRGLSGLVGPTEAQRIEGSIPITQADGSVKYEYKPWGDRMEKQGLFTPPVDAPRLEQKEGDSKLTSTAKAAFNTASSAVFSGLSIGGLATLGTGSSTGLGARAVGGLFAADMASMIPEQIHNAQGGTFQERMEGLLGAGASLVGAGLGAHAMVRKPVPGVIGEFTEVPLEEHLKTVSDDALWSVAHDPQQRATLPYPDTIVENEIARRNVIRAAADIAAPVTEPVVETTRTTAAAPEPTGRADSFQRAMDEQAPADELVAETPVQQIATSAEADAIQTPVESAAPVVSESAVAPESVTPTETPASNPAEAARMQKVVDAEINGLNEALDPSEALDHMEGIEDDGVRQAIAKQYGIETEGKSANDLNLEIADKALEVKEVASEPMAEPVPEEVSDWASATAPREQLFGGGTKTKNLEVGIMPKGMAEIIKTGEVISDAAKKVAASIRDIPKFTDFRKSVLDWSGVNQAASGEVFKAARDITKAVPDAKRRAAITNWIQAGGDDAVLAQRAKDSTNGRLKDGYTAARNLSPEEKVLAGKIRQTYDELLKRANANGINVSEIENYVNQIWKRQPLKQFAASSNRKLSESIRFAKQRYYDSFFDGEKAGLKPETKDIAKLLPIYMNEVNNAIASKQFVANLAIGKASDGRPLVAPRGGGSVVADPKGPGVQLVFPERAAKDTVDYKVLAQPALHDWKWVGKDSDGRNILVKGDLAVHPEIYNHLKNTLGQSAFREWWNSPSETPLGSAGKTITKFLIDDLQQISKATMLGFLSPFHQVQEGTHAIGHKVNPFFNIPKIDLTNAAQMDAAKHGLMLLPDRVSSQQFREGLDGSGKNIASNLIGKLGKPGAAIKEWSEGYQDYLFHQYIPGLKLKTYDHIVPRNMERYKADLASGVVTEDQVKYLSAQQANAAYGHLNYADMGRNPTIQHLAQALLLAPDFLEARGRFTGQAAKGIVSKVGREQLAAIMTLAVTQYIASRALNKTLDDDYHWDHPFSVINGNREYTMRSVPEDIYKAFKDTRKFVSGRISPVIGRGLLEGLSGVNYRGEPTTIGDTFTNILSSSVPLTLQPATRGLSETSKDNPVSPIEQLIGSLGLHVSRFSPVSATYYDAKDWIEREGKKYGIESKKAVFPISKYQQLRYALEDSDSEKAKSEITRLLAEEKITRSKLDERFKESINHPFTGSRKTDRIFRDSLEEEKQQRFDAAIKRRKVLLDRYRATK